MAEIKEMEVSKQQETKTNGTSKGIPEVAKNSNAVEKKKKRMPKKIKAAIIIVILLAIAAGAVFLIRSLLKKPEDIGANVAVVTRGRLESYVSGWGSTTSKSKADLGKDLKGKVMEVNVKSGDRVKAGDVIFTVDPTEMQQSLDDALTELDRVNDGLTKSSNDIANLKVTAPFKGKLITVADNKVGQMLSSGAAVGLLVDDSQMKLELYFSYGYIEDIKAGMNATVSIPSSMTNVTGTVQSIEKIKKITQDGSLLFKVIIMMDNPGTLTKDQIATATINTANGAATPSEAGKLKYNREEEVKTKVDGEITDIQAYEYHEYAAGATLLQMKNDSLKTNLSSSQRTYDAAAKKVEELQKSLAECVQTAPIDGVVTGVMIEVGDELKASGTPVVTIADLTKIVVDINIDEMDISKVQAGMQVELTYDKSDGQSMLMGELTSVSMQAKSDSNNGMGGSVSYFPARITINEPGDLMPGVGVQYKISALVKEDCLLVPSSSVIYTPDGATAVYAKTEQLKGSEEKTEVPAEQLPKGYTAVKVTIGVADDTNTEITGGIEEGIEVYNPSPQDPNGMMGGGMMMAY